MLDIRVDIAPGADPDAVPSTWQWRDISGYRRQAANIELNQGRDDEAAVVEAADSTIVFDLRDGLLAPRNPNSELYGRIGVNTPIRYRLRIAEDTFSRTVVGAWGPADSGQSWLTGSDFNAVNGGSGKVAIAAADSATVGLLMDTAALDIEVVYSISLPVVTTGAPWISAVMLRRVDEDNFYRVHTELKPAGVITMKVARVLDGVSSDLAEDLTVTGTYVADGKVWTRAQAVGGSIRCKAWVGTFDDEPADWNIVTNAITIEGGEFGFYQWRFIGNTNVGTLTASIDDFTLDAMLWNGFVPEWSPRWDRSGEDSTLTLAPAGPIRRLTQGEESIESPLRRQLPSYDPGGYWPLEDSTGATSAGSALPAGRVARVTDVSFGDDDAPPGALSSMKINSASSSARGYTTGDTGAEFAALVFFKLGAVPVGEQVLIEWQCSAGTLRRWIIYFNSTGFVLRVYDSDGNLDHTNSSTYAADPLQWVAIQLETLQDGANVDYALLWHQIDSETFYAITGQINANTTGRLSGWQIYGSAELVDTRFSHIWQGPESLPFVTDTFHKVANGYDGEAASARMLRLMQEEGLILNFPTADTEAMGVQTSAKFEDLIRECEAADGGVLIERGPSYVYIPREIRYNPPVKLALDWTGGDLAEAPQPTDDDQRLFTRWKVSRKFGSEAVYTNEEARAKHGQITNTKEINISDDDRLALHAAWATALTTVDDMRWPTIELDLIAHPEFIPTFLTCRIGSRVTLANPKDQVAGTEIDVIIEGIKQVIGRHRWRVTLACSPAKVWTEIGIWDDDDSLWDSASTTLAADRDASQTAWSISSENPEDVWAAGSSGYLWEVGGEHVEVASVAAATGTGPYVQAVTVVRAQNGVSKAQTAGTPVRLAHPVRWGL
jgi:hypothetical protein